MIYFCLPRDLLRFFHLFIAEFLNIYCCIHYYLLLQVSGSCYTITSRGSLSFVARPYHYGSSIVVVVVVVVVVVEVVIVEIVV